MQPGALLAHIFLDICSVKFDRLVESADFSPDGNSNTDKFYQKFRNTDTGEVQ